jgi:2-oxoisovalerate dehydrogenase E1 component
LEVHDTISKIAADIRVNPRPVLVEAMTFRMRGHEEASGTKYVPKELMEKWAKKDPVEQFELYLLRRKVIDADYIEKTREKIKKQIDQHLDKAYGESHAPADTIREIQDMYAPFEAEVVKPETENTAEIRLVDAISQGLRQSMHKYPELVLMGQDIAEYGGVFKITEGFVNEFGKGRVRNTPLCESAILGIGLGLSIRGMKSMIEMQFADFVTSGFNQIVNNLAKAHYRWGQHADVVIRMPTGAGVGAGPYHSQSNEAWFFHTPGLKIVYPSNPEDAKGLLCAALEDPNPVLFFEHKYLYRSLTGEVPEAYYTVPIGVASQVQEGSDISVVTYGMGVHWAKSMQEEMPEISFDIVDLRSLLPWDKEAVGNSVKRTNRVIVLHEDCLTGGVGAEIAAWISEECFKHLDAPVMRVASLDTAVPFAAALEKNFLPVDRLREKINQMLEF